jgi:hypothetical protein
MSSAMKTFLFFTIAIVALWNLSFQVHVQAQPIANCGAYGVDLSSLSTADISGTLNGWTWVIRTCGAVSDAVCNNDTTSRNSSVCQRGATSASNAYGLSFWNHSAVVYSRTRSAIIQQLITGEMCGANPRQSIIYFECNASATTPFISFVREYYTCQYTFTVQTSLTCALPQEPSCTFDGVDLNPMFAGGELNFTNNYRWYVRMCSSAPSNVNCSRDATANNTMVCQQRLDYSDNFGLATYNESTVQWQSIPTGPNAGLLITVPNGEFCSAVNNNRQSRILLLCDPTLGPRDSYIYAVSEVQTCIYQITIRTSYSCAAVRPTSSTGAGISLSSSWFPPSNGGNNCSFNGVDYRNLFFSPDLSWGGFIGNTYYDFFFRMCGIVRNSQCLSDSSTYNSMICQVNPSNPRDIFALDYYVPERWTWSSTAYGTRYVSTAGEICNGRPRTTTIEFQCDNGDSRISSVTYDPTNSCNFYLIVKTNIVCAVAPLPPSSTGPAAAVPDCVYNGWDFKQLTARGDLSLFVMGGTNYTIFLKMCGVVSAPQCRRDSTATSAMVCQARTDALDSYSLGAYNPVTQNWTEYTNTSTITMLVDGGEMCGANPRRTLVTFICDREYSTRTGNNTGMVFFNETSTCFYATTVVANDIICPYFERSGANLTRSSSSSSTGGGVIAISSSAMPDIPASCISGNQIPANAVAISFVFNAPPNALASNFTAVLADILNKLFNTNQVVCGPVIPGGSIVANAIGNTTDGQSITTVYVVPGAQPVDIIGGRIATTVQTNPTAITSQLPTNAPAMDPTQYQSLACTGDQIPDVQSNTCVNRPEDDSSSGLSDGAIAGIVVGSVVGGLLLLAICSFLLLRGRKARSGESRSVEMSKH